ncbi:hypothetical protein NC651_000560 [Populus alba x Populus x berolinensis]|nr:hypothetical protein NC651_000560 [Populus alba x Populus x berolinensis]
MGKVSRRSAGENESIDWKKASRNSLQRIFRQVMRKKLGSMDILARTTFSTYKAYQEVLGDGATAGTRRKRRRSAQSTGFLVFISDGAWICFSFTLHTDFSIWSWASLLMVEASGLGQAMVVVLLLADGCGRRRWSQFMEAKRGAGSPVKTALLRLVAKESAVDGG